MADPDLEIRGWGRGGQGEGIQTLRQEGAVSKKIFSALRASVSSKNKGGLQSTECILLRS